MNRLPSFHASPAFWQIGCFGVLFALSACEPYDPADESAATERKSAAPPLRGDSRVGPPVPRADPVAAPATRASDPFPLDWTAPADTFSFRVVGVGAGSYDPPPANILHAPAPGPAKVRFLADLSGAAGGGERYTIAASVSDTGWQVETDTPAFILGAPGVVPFRVWLTPGAGAGASVLTLRIQDASLTQHSTRQFTIQP